MSSFQTELAARLNRLRGRIDDRLGTLVPERGLTDALSRSARYSLLAPGKRVRPILTILTCEAFGGREQAALDAACSVEMVHTASLMLDDLPSMDDAVRRRGRATNHKVFGDDVTTLAAFSLLNRAYEVVVTTPGISDSIRLNLVRTLTSAIGDEGIIAGQFRDLRADPTDTDLSQVERTHHQKTGSLFVAAVEIGARVAGVSEERLEPVRTFASNFGLFFQVLDDLVDGLSSAPAAGKDVRKDANKATFVTTLGSDGARSAAERFAAAAERALDPVGPAGAPLAGLARSLLDSTTLPASSRP